MEPGDRRQLPHRRLLLALTHTWSGVVAGHLAGGMNAGVRATFAALRVVHMGSADQCLWSCVWPLTLPT